jgi:hypothetical protein
MKADIFLSIDIDYWNPLHDRLLCGADNAVDVLEKYLDDITCLARTSNIPLSAVMNHQQMLKKVDASPARQLYNIDSHSDLADANVADFNCGTWVSYVRWRHEGSYFWIRDVYADGGDCNGGVTIFSEDSVRDELTDWQNISSTWTEAPKPKKIIKQCAEICVCMSPFYCTQKFIPVFHAWRKKHNVPYMKGLVNESHSRKALPPFRKPFELKH